MTGGYGDADERKGWSGAEGMVRRGGRGNGTYEWGEWGERGYIGDWVRGMSRGN
jgi:hypothetical protein